MSQTIQPDTLASMMAEIERRLHNLETQPIRQLTSGLADPSMAVDLTTPALTVKDASSVTRVLLGKLDALGGTYLGQYGLVISDATGAPILDTTGLQQGLKLLTSKSTGGQTLGFNTAWTQIPGSNIPTFTLTRPGSVLFLGSCTWVGNGGTANYVSTEISIYNNSGPTLLKQSPEYYETNGAGLSNATAYSQISPLAAGTYYAQWDYRMNAGATTTVTVNYTVLHAFQFGG